MGEKALPWARGEDSASTDAAGNPQPDPVAVDRVARYSGFRPEIQGLRAVAVFMVVFYHIFLGRVSGGVDIFLLISAFFMTLSFVRKLEGGRPLQLVRYWLHTFKRLLPLAVLTVLGTLGLTALFLPASRYQEVIDQAIATVTYTQNWELAFTQVDYYAVDRSTASPLQHFWSLSVQGQVFLLWPLIFGLTWLIVRRTRWRAVPVLATAFGLVFVASLTFSVITTASQQEFAYFDTRTRLWEFALGSLLALAIPYLNPPQWARVVLGWLGFVSMILVGLVVDVQGAFPGWIALWPLLSAAAIMVAGQSNSPLGLDRIFASRTLVKLGDASYALYLVHWPLLITYLVIRDRTYAGPISGIALILLSLVLAIAATKFIEQPLKSWKWPELTKPRLAGAVVLCMAVGITPAVAWQQSIDRQLATVAVGPNVNNPGAYIFQPGYQDTGNPNAVTIPLPAQLDWQTPQRGPQCPQEWDIPESAQVECTDATPAITDPDRTVLLVGNSHTEHWLDTLRPVAEANNWRIVTYIGLGCFITSPEDQAFDNCKPWLEGVDPIIEAVDPDLIVTQSTFTNVDVEYERAGFRERMQRYTDEGRQILGIRDIPRFDEPLVDCALTAPDINDPECFRTHSMLGTEDPMAEMGQENPRFAEVDLLDQICPDEQCRPAVGNIFVQRDRDHLSLPYSRSLAPVFTERMTAALAQDGFEVPVQPDFTLPTDADGTRNPTADPVAPDQVDLDGS
ncbi:acyltransferase family protein [Kocuria sp.]|uniref:acyltransferase family protein n=1 Tax=Kocuria sp. TaxID=1871328 RepID=UPI0026E10E04|nr:acyltransferase family protein [Kocuria sp.]MDO5617321.1 acyltransferase family protein [Kocuria sp.]